MHILISHLAFDRATGNLLGMHQLLGDMDSNTDGNTDSNADTNMDTNTDGNMDLYSTG